MTKFAMIDTKRAPGFYVDRFERVERNDDTTAATAAPDDPRDHASAYRVDPTDADAFPTQEDADAALAQDEARYDAFHMDEWWYVGVMARAHCVVVGADGVGTCFMLDSAGLWGIESDSGEAYLAEVFADEVDALKATINAMRDPIYPVTAGIIS